MTHATNMPTYNPHLLTREDLVASFVARRPLVDDLVDDLRRGGHQHHLLVGARGSGKTTLLLRLAVAIEDDKKLARAALPLRFPEEQYNVASPSDFWLNCLDALADALEARGDHAGKRKLESSIASIEVLPEEERSPAALRALTQWAKHADRLLVLLVDNLGLILERLRDAQWDLREALSRDNRLVLIGATSTFLEESASYESPLYDFFNLHELGQLSEQESRTVVAQLAKRTGAADVQAVLENDPGRFKALYVLTGGMPRMLALLASVLAQSAGPAESDLEKMLDQLTPYYKARFDELPSQAQILVDAIALHWHPITAAECAERTRIEINVVSAQLHRLVKLGLLTKVSISGASRLGYQLVERFFNIWYLMRASRRARQKLTWFVEFLRMFYGEEELSRRAQAVLDREPKVTTPTHVLALAAAVPDMALRRRLECRAVTMLVEGIRSERIHELLDLGGVDAHLLPVLDRARAHKQLRERVGASSKLQRLAPKILRDPFLELGAKSGYIDRLAREGGKASPGLTAGEPGGGWTDRLGERLIAAIERGEVPSLSEVTTVDDAAALIGLAHSPDLTALLILSFMDFGQRGDDALIEFLLDTAPDAAPLALMSAAASVRNAWLQARSLAHLVLRRGMIRRDKREWEEAAVFFCSACVRHGHAADAAELLSELGLRDRWLPLHEAVLAADGDRNRLSRLAPEVRAPTEVILAKLGRRSPAEGPKPEPRALPAKKRIR